MKKPREVFVDITIKSYEGRKQDLKPFFDAAFYAVRRLCNERNIFLGMVGRRAIVTRRSHVRAMNKHGLYK